MKEIKEQLLKAKHNLEKKYEPPNELITRLKEEGKSMGEIENAILELNRIGGVYDSVVTALRILEGQKKIYKIDDDIKFKDTL